MFLKNRNISSKIKRSKVTDYAALTSFEWLYKKTGWESLASRREKSIRVLFYKMLNGITPEYLSCLDTPSVRSTNTRYRLRNDSDLQTIPATCRSLDWLPSSNLVIHTQKYLLLISQSNDG